MPTIAPSILSSDFAELGAEIARVERGGAGAIHVDVMDGHFVPNLTLGPVVVEAVRRATRLPVDVHLMIDDPDAYIEPFRKAGADWISVHVEAARHLQRTLAKIRESGASPGVVLNPGSPISLLEEVLEDLDFILVMSVNPGFGGQSFLPGSIDKLRRLRALCQERNLTIKLEIDGGIGEGNAREVVEAGADVLVAGSAIFGQKDPEEATRRLSQVAEGVAVSESRTE